MSVRAMSWVWSLRGIPAPTRLVLMAIADWADDEGVAWPAVDTIADKVELSHRTVQRHLHAAEAHTLLTITQRAGSSLYKLHLHEWGDKLSGVTPVTSGGDSDDTPGVPKSTPRGDTSDTQQHKASHAK